MDKSCENKSETPLQWLINFRSDLTRDATFDLYNDLKPSEFSSHIENLWNKFSNIYLISCSPFTIDDRKASPEIYNILKRYQHTAEWRPLEILIWEYSDETMNEMNIKTEELKKQYRWMNVSIQSPKKYMHIVGYYWWTSWRTIQEIIKTFKECFPKRIKTITPTDLTL